jgi:UDP-N-acetylmuramate--alanine ligase
VTSALVADALIAAGGHLTWRGTREELPAALAAQVLPGDVVLTVGAGDVTKVGPALLEELGGGRPRAEAGR